jgi:tetratricopeptide (TPR) repeat protein
VHYSRLAADDAIARLAFDEARQHYERALTALELVPQRTAADRQDLLLRLGEALNCAGDARAAFAALREAADLARGSSDPATLARAAIAVHDLGWRYAHTEAIVLLEDAVRRLPPEPSALRGRVLAALARDLHHAVGGERDWDRAPTLAAQAVEEARLAEDPAALAFCLLALHDARWRPATAASRLPIIDEMLAVSVRAGDGGMAAQARLLRATALIELGDPDGPAELEAFCRQSEDLGHARGQYGAITRRATLAVILGDLDRAHALAAEGLALGEEIGEQTPAVCTRRCCGGPTAPPAPGTSRDPARIRVNSSPNRGRVYPWWRHRD